MPMKNIVLLALVSLPAFVLAQERKFEIQGTIGHLSTPAKVYLKYIIGSQNITDSATLVNGKFKLSGIIKGDALKTANLMLNKKGTGPTYDDFTQVYLEPGTINVTSADAISTAEITGTKTNDDKAKYNELLKSFNKAFVDLDEKEKPATDEGKQSEAYSKATKNLQVQQIQLQKKFIQDKPDSYISLDVLHDLSYNTDYPELVTLYNGLSPQIKASEQAKPFAAMLPILKTVAIGATAPEFTQPDTAGKLVSLSSFRGEYVLIDFWASWCVPCRGENPNLVKAYNRFKNQKFTILGVSLDQLKSKTNWLAAIRKDGLPWTQVSDLKAWKNEAVIRYAIHFVPQNFLLDPNGKIIAKNLRGEDLDNKLEELFGKM